LKAFKERDQPKVKLQQITKLQDKSNSSNTLRNLISCVQIVDIDEKLNNYLKIAAILNNMFRPQKTLKKTRINSHNTLAFTAYLHSKENWTTKAKDARGKVRAEEMKYLRKTTVNNLADYKMNIEFSNEFKCNSCFDYIRENRSIK